MQSQLLDYSYKGGFVGYDDHLVIDRNGTAHLTRRRKEYEFVVPVEVLRQLETFLRSTDFVEFRWHYAPSGGAVDVAEHTLTIDGNTIYASDISMPAALEPVVSILQQLISANSAEI